MAPPALSLASFLALAARGATACAFAILAVSLARLSHEVSTSSSSAPGIKWPNEAARSTWGRPRASRTPARTVETLRAPTYTSEDGSLATCARSAWHLQPACRAGCRSLAEATVLTPTSRIRWAAEGTTLVCHRCGAWWTEGDALFAHVERVQARVVTSSAARGGEVASKWGRVLDAGMGYASLRWIQSLGGGVDSCEGVTADAGMMRAMLNAGLGREDVEATRTGAHDGSPAEGEGAGGGDGSERGEGGRASHECGGGDGGGDSWRASKSAACRLLLGRWVGADGGPPALPPVLNLTRAAYDVVLADYLVGAVEGFEPYAQDAVLAKLTDLLAPGGVLYIVAAEPAPLRSEVRTRGGVTREGGEGVTTHGDGGATRGDAEGDTQHSGRFEGPGPAGKLLAAVAEARDAAVLLSGERPYREFPASWYLDAVRGAGLDVIEHAAFPAIRTRAWALKQLSVARQHLAQGAAGGGDRDNGVEEGLDEGTARAMRLRVARIEEEVRASVHLEGGTCFGMDFVIAARKRGNE